MINKYNVNSNLADPKHVQFDGVLVNEHKTVVTNGFYLLEVEKPQADQSVYPDMPNAQKEQEQPHIIPAKSAEAIQKALKAKNSVKLPILDNACKVAGGYVICKDLRTPVTVSYQEGQASDFPKYEQLFPEDPAVVSFDINPVFLKELVSALVEAKDERITVEVRGDRKPIVLKGTFPTGQAFRALIMPKN